MNEKRFSKMLARNLRGVTREERREILADYVEHFRVGRAEGKTDSEIAAQLGDPVEIAREYDTAARGVERPGKEPRPRRVVAGALTALLLWAFNILVVIWPLLALAIVLGVLWFVSWVPFYSGYTLASTSSEVARTYGFGGLSQAFGPVGLFAFGVFYVALMLLVSRGYGWLVSRYIGLNRRVVRWVKGA